MERFVYIARFAHETNTFSPVPTPRSSFMDFFEGTPAQGFEAVCAQRGVVTRRGPMLSAMPSARVHDAAFEDVVGRIVDDVRTATAAGTLHAVLLDLHGAMVTESLQDAEGELLRRVRAATGVPIGVAFDLHGNATPAMAANCTLMLCYKTYPHIDMVATGERVAAQLLDWMASGVAVGPFQAIATPPVLSHTLRSATLDPNSAMSQVVARGIELERSDADVLSVNVFAGFSLADVACAGVSVVVVHRRSAAEAQRLAHQFGQMVWRLRAGFVYTPEPLAASVARAVALERTVTGKPVLLLDHGDNLMSGGASNTTTLLREVLAQGVPGPYAVGPLCDGAAAAAAIAAGLNGHVSVAVGDPPLPLQGRVVGINAAGTFRVTGPIFTGLLANMGAAAALQLHDGSVVVVCSVAFEPYDPGCFTSLGVQPAAFRFVLLKSCMYARPCFVPMAGGLVECDTRGSTSSDYALFQHRHLRKPVYPLDADCTYEHE